MTTSMVLLASRSCNKIGCERDVFFNIIAGLHPMTHYRDRDENERNRVGMTYLKGLSNAEDDRNTTLNGGLGLAGNELWRMVSLGFFSF